jgi:pimeloyl-ACP methyl ester carboxylesterase
MSRQALSALVAAQARLTLALAAGYDGRVLGSAARAVGGTPRVEEVEVGGVGAELSRPARGSGPWPVVVVLPGVTRRGRGHPALRAVARGLAASGHLTVLAEPEGLASGEVAPEALAQTRAVVAATVSRRDARGARTAVVGVSGGASLGLLVAADRELGERVSAVAALAPCCDFVEAMRVATTGVYRDGNALVPFETRDFLKLVVARSVAATLPPSDGTAALRSDLAALEDYGPEPLEQLRALPRGGLDPAARAAVELLSNTDSARFEGLLRALPDDLREQLDGLSPLGAASRISAPVEVIVGRADKYFPPADAETFARACPSARLTVLESLEHAVPSVSPSVARDLLRFDGVLVRLLAAARGAASYS